MLLSKTFLTRGNQKAVLQGMIHIGPDKLYEMLQYDINLATENGYQIFFEGVKKYPTERKLNQNEKNIQKFFMFLFDLYPVFAESLGISTQKEKIKYPEGAVNADITFDTLTQKLDENGFKCKSILKIFSNINQEEMKEIKEYLTEKDNLKKLMDSSKKWSFSKLIFWFIFRKAMPIILDHRNQVVAEKIKIYSNKDIFIHYGEKHVRGILKLLKRDGWVVNTTTYTEIEEYL